MASLPIVPVILSGGSGTRLWPMSTPERPKQFLPLAGEATLFEATLARVPVGAGFAPPVIVAAARHAPLIEAQLGEVPATLLLEPAPRNTAPAIALAVLLADPRAPLLVMPSDHVIADVGAFHAAVARAAAAAADSWLVTFGIAPDAPETGYGYIALGAPIADGVRAVDRFVEKPGAQAAAAMVADGQHVWNGGIFLFTAGAFLAALDRHAPQVLAAARAAMAGARREGAEVHPDAGAWEAAPAISVDYAVMERAERVACVPVAMGWSDLGSWDALHALSAGGVGNPHQGPVVALDTENCLLRSDRVRIAAVGVRDLIVVAHGDDVLILPRGRAQDVKALVAQLEVRR